MPIWRSYKAAKLDLPHTLRPDGVRPGRRSHVERAKRRPLPLIQLCLKVRDRAWIGSSMTRSKFGQVLDHRIAQFAVARMVEGSEHWTSVYFEK